MTSTLVVKAVRDRWRSLMWWGIGMVTIAGFQLAVYPSIKADQAAYEKLANSFPDAMKYFFDIESYTSPAGYLNVELFSMVVPFVFISVGVAAGAAATAGEEERGTLDLLLTLPIRRWSVVLAKAAALALSLLALSVVTVGALIGGAQVVGLDIAASRLVAGTAASLLLGMLFGSVGLLLGAVSGRRGVALGGALALALAAFLLESLASAASWLDPWQPASPWYWVLGNEPVRHGLDLGYAGVTLAVTGVVLTAAALVFAKRDVTT